MAFDDRLAKAGTVVEIVNGLVWGVAPVSDTITVVPYGYETHVPDSVRQQLRYVRTVTARLVRFFPDFFVLDAARPANLYLLEYKATTTPLYSNSRISRIAKTAGKPGLGWQDIGQMEADAYDNYVALQGLGVRVAVLNYCAYHDRPLLCDYVENVTAVHRDSVQLSTTKGSRTPFINFDCRELRSLDLFIEGQHGVVPDAEAYSAACEALRSALPVEHHRQSPLYPMKT